LRGIDVTSHPKTLAELPTYSASRFGAKLAICGSGIELSFVQVEERVSALANGLCHLGLKAGDRVVLHLPNTWHWAVSYYAIARIGAVVVPANIMLVSEELDYIAKDCGAAAIIAPDAAVVALQKHSRAANVRYVALGEAIPNGAFSWNELLMSPPLLTAPSVEPDAISTIGYTSGTTGRAKGAVLTHRCVILNTAMTATLHVRTASDTVVSALPCSHVYGNVVLNGTFFCGYTLVLLERFDADLALESVERHRATLFEGVPTMYYYILGSTGLARRNLKSLTRTTVGGQTMPLQHLREVRERFDCPLLELWGMTEIAGLGTTHALYGPEMLGSIGQALPFSQCRIADTHDPSKTLASGEIGELQFRGPTVMQGYYQRTTETAEVMCPGNWLRTGDVGYCDKDGYLFVVDRIKEMIITAGYNIYPSEIERVIATHPAVQMVAVGGMPDETKGEIAHAYVVVRSSVAVDQETLISYCRSHLAPYKVPKAIHFVRDLPKTSTGKIMRRALRTLPV
jgi:long-chain acyl-CoA synthetase